MVFFLRGGENSRKICSAGENSRDFLASGPAGLRTNLSCCEGGDSREIVRTGGNSRKLDSAGDNSCDFCSSGPACPSCSGIGFRAIAGPSPQGAAESLLAGPVILELPEGSGEDQSQEPATLLVDAEGDTAHEFWEEDLDGMLRRVLPCSCLAVAAPYSEILGHAPADLDFWPGSSSGSCSGVFFRCLSLPWL